MVNKPSISVNKLGEYIISRGARQRKILHDRKYPDPDFQPGMYYREAAEAIKLYIAHGAIDPSPLDKAQPTGSTNTGKGRHRAPYQFKHQFLGAL